MKVHGGMKNTNNEPLDVKPILFGDQDIILRRNHQTRQTWKRSNIWRITQIMKPVWTDLGKKVGFAAVLPEKKTYLKMPLYTQLK